MSLYLPQSPEDKYKPGVFIIKFNQDVPDITVSENLVVTGIESVDAMNTQYGVYGYEELYPLPAEPVNHPEGLWKWEDLLAARAEFNLQRIFVFKISPDYADVAKVIIPYFEDENTEYVELVTECKCYDITPNDPYFDIQWHLPKIKCLKAWEVSKGANTVIAVLDTGCMANHPDLMAKYVPGWDFVGDDNDPNDEDEHGYPPCGHGTHVAGIAAAVTDNNTGVAGIGWLAKIMPIRVLNRQAQGDTSEIAKGIHYAANHGADVINMSFGQRGPSNALREAVGYAYKLDVLLVASAGNDYWGDKIKVPARYGPVIAVGATDRFDGHCGFSNCGDELELTAPGQTIYSTLREPPFYGYKTGTSMASPCVASVAALCRSKWPESTAPQIRKILQGFSDDLGPPGWDRCFGWGRVNAYRALVHLIAEPYPLEEVVAEAEALIDEKLRASFERCSLPSDEKILIEIAG